LDSICSAIAWCDGAARRFKEIGDTIGLQAVWKTLNQDIFNHLRFSLAQRVQWEDAYGLPESIVPVIYQSVTKLITDIYLSGICDLLNFIEEQFDCQCGIYSEGFRSILNQVLTTVISKPVRRGSRGSSISIAGSLERIRNI
ncbi:hypothetical protein, partial [Vibrio cholerae]|uniref:hypothetical protein n=1 Tax=Vibrio cholerae TaxID=666 RepID=UPI001F17D8E3